MDMLDITLKKEYGIYRDPKKGIGKRIGHRYYVYKDYALHSDIPFFKQALLAIPPQFDYTFIVFDNLKQSISFVYSPDWYAHEPTVGERLTVSILDNFVSPPIFTKGRKIVLHHKWLLVSDTYTGWSVTESKLRSLEWKRAAKGETIACKIGSQVFWEQWLTRKGLDSRLAST